MKEMLEQVREALLSAGFPLFELWPVMGRGDQAGKKTIGGTVTSNRFQAFYHERRQSELNRELSSFLPKDIIHNLHFSCFTELELTDTLSPGETWLSDRGICLDSKKDYEPVLIETSLNCSVDSIKEEDFAAEWEQAVSEVGNDL